MIGFLSALIMFGLATALALPSTPAHAEAQKFPVRQITIVVTFPAGGNADRVARLIAERLHQQLGQPVIVDNRPGSATMVGTNAVVQAPADGYTLLQSGTNTNINPLLGHKTPYDAERDLMPVALLVQVPGVLVANAEVPAKTVAELIALAKAKPGVLNYGSAGVGTFPHLALEQFAQRTGTQMTHVPFKGFAPAMLGLLRNDVQLLSSDIPGAMPHLKSGKLRALAFTGRKRLPQLPDLPTLDEAGVKGYEAAGFLGIMVRTGTPLNVISTLNREINRALEHPDVAKQIASSGLLAGGGTPGDFAAHLNRDRAIWSKVIAGAGIKAK